MLAVIFPQVPGLFGILNVPCRYLLLHLIFFRVLLQEGPSLHFALQAQLDGLSHASLPSGPETGRGQVGLPLSPLPAPHFPP